MTYELIDEYRPRGLTRDEIAAYEFCAEAIEPTDDDETVRNYIAQAEENAGADADYTALEDVLLQYRNALRD